MREMPDGTEWCRCPSFNKFRMSGWGFPRPRNRPSRVIGNPVVVAFKDFPFSGERRVGIPLAIFPALWHNSCRYAIPTAGD